MEILNFKGLYGDNQLNTFSNFLQVESLETRSKVYNWEIQEHLHSDLIQLFLIKSGTGLLLTDHIKIEIQGPTTLHIPNNTMHGFKFNSNINGWVITFSENFLENIFKSTANVLQSFSSISQIEFHENPSVFEKIELLTAQISKELIDNLPEKNLSISALFQLIYITIYRLSVQNSDETSTHNRTLTYYRNFYKSVKKSFADNKSIKEYANELNITTVHLNRICQTISQQSALQIVQAALMTEAKKYLLNTSYTVAEVAYFLNFNDPAYFTRLFKKLVGQNPTEFRKN